MKRVKTFTSMREMEQTKLKKKLDQRSTYKIYPQGVDKLVIFRDRDKNLQKDYNRYSTQKDILFF